jgi:hypothetical protein
MLFKFMKRRTWYYFYKNYDGKLSATKQEKSENLVIFILFFFLYTGQASDEVYWAFAPTKY